MSNPTGQAARTRRQPGRQSRSGSACLWAPRGTGTVDLHRLTGPVDGSVEPAQAITDRLPDIEAIVLTHGHEDHIGAVPYLLRQRPDILVIGSRLTLSLLSAKLVEHRITPTTLEVREGDRLDRDPFALEFLAVNHSIPDGLAVAVRTTAGLVLHTGDFKMDQFLGRKVAFVGRSMVRNMGVARELGYLTAPDGLIVDAGALDRLPDVKQTLICTGSQGEPMAALARMASSLVPGNENAVYRIINGLTRRGANVVHKGNAKVHVSGHANAGELVYC